MDSIELVNSITWLERIGLSEGLVAACIIGTFGLCGILITQNSERKKEYKAFLRIKFEELVFRLVDFAAIIKEVEAKRFLKNYEKTLDVDKFYREGGKIEILIALYFPELEEEYVLFLRAGANLLIAQREYETNPSDSILNILEKNEEAFDQVYDDFYKHIKSCSSTYAKPLKRRTMLSIK
ncbi:hypothetical protein [Psychrobacter aquaticus]|uniref:hypothetical protein n=1 Tax=Psychrobacter aquaticus TaxID=248452 RepID=UPI00059135F8|nr:hypothetical protein [Psychrobacter aquaticus]